MSETQTHSLVKALQSVPDLSTLDDRALLAIVGASLNLFYASGSKVFEKGSSSEGLYIVLSGEMRIHDPDDPSDEEFRVGPGHSFGELSLLLEAKHSKTAEAIADTELLVLPEESFRELLEATPELATHFQRRLEEQVQVRGDTRTQDEDAAPE